MFSQGSEKETRRQGDKNHRSSAVDADGIDFGGEELHFANRIRDKLPSPFPLLFCGRPLSIYLNGDSQAPTVCGFTLRSALCCGEPHFPV